MGEAIAYFTYKIEVVTFIFTEQTKAISCIDSGREKGKRTVVRVVKQRFNGFRIINHFSLKETPKPFIQEGCGNKYRCTGSLILKLLVETLPIINGLIVSLVQGHLLGSW